MEDVIFQGSTGRRPVNVAEVSLVFDNSDGTLPIAYQEVLVTRRLSRSGQSEYLLNRSAVRLRDIQDLLRGTGLGADAAVVMEARMIEALLSEKAEERRALFEEAAGIGLYRDRKTSTERRLEETAADLARLEDLVSEVQTQVRSLARQRGKAERYGKMIEERFGIALTLVRRELEDFDLTLGGLGQRAEQLAAALPGERTRLEQAEQEREAGVQARHTAEARRTEVERRLADAKLESGRLEGDLALAAERLRNAGQRRATAAQRREQEEARALQAERERAAAAAECEAAERDLASVGQELAGRTAFEQEGRDRLLAQRAAVRELEEDLQRRAEGSRALEGERAALERERAELGQQLADASQERARRAETEWAATAQVGTRAEQAAALARAAAQAAAGLEQARRRVAELKEQETHGRAARRQAEEALAQVTARHDALAELERERVGLAPAAQALLKAREQFGDAVIGPLSDFVRTTRRDAVLAEQLLGEWLHAVLAAAEAAFAAAGAAAERARQQELEAGASKDDAERAAAHAQREATEATAQVERLQARLGEVGARLDALHADLEGHEVERVRLDERLGRERAQLVDLEAQQEAAREQRVRWQVDAAQVEARLGAARERAGRAAAEVEEARRQSAALAEEIGALEHDTATLTAQRTQWEDQLKERRLALVALESAAREAGVQVEAADARVAQTEAALEDTRKALDARGAEEHKLELERTEVLGRRRGLVARGEAEWRKPLDQLLADAPEVAGDLEWLRQEDERLRAAIDAVGPVNALEVDEHGEEVKRLEFLMTQRDDLVAARQSLQQAAREIDQTAKAMFLDSFGKVRENFRTVFQTLFGGGECDVRLANEDEPLESEIEIHAAPRGKRTQRIHLLSSGERTLVAVSLLFAIFLTKPSPFCLLDEVDAPLDDANVGRYVRLLAEFKDLTQFIVITHNPRTMQAADAVYGVTMQEPGVSTIVGVRLGQMEPV